MSRDFMARRRMFAVVRDELLVAPVGSPRSHREWLADVSDFEFARSPRGFYLDKEIVFYRRGFEPVSSRAIHEHLSALRDALGLDDDVVVMNGATMLDDDSLVGRDRLGTVGELAEPRRTDAPTPG